MKIKLLAVTAKSGNSMKPHADFYESVIQILRSARAKAHRAIDSVMVEAYWDVGRMIVEEEQQGNQRAEYGAFLIRNLSIRLTSNLGSGYSEPSLWNMRQFYQAFPILSAVRRELTWTHYKSLIRVGNSKARTYYLQEAIDQNWDTRTLARQIRSFYYDRRLMNRKKLPGDSEMPKKTSAPHVSRDFIKDPMVLEFIGLQDNCRLRESSIEQAIIGKLQAFMLELGKGFAFVGRQYRLSTETKDFFVDLVFYNHILKCFVLVDLKTNDLTHQDIGQMDMYVRVFEDRVKGVDDNPTVGLILCAEKDHTIVKYSVLNESQQIFASKYQFYLPTEEELREEIERERMLAVKEEGAIYQARIPHSRQLYSEGARGRGVSTFPSRTCSNHPIII